MPLENTTLSTPDEQEQIGLLYRSRLLEDPSAPLLVLLHGRTGTVDIMWSFEKIFSDLPFSVVSFQAPYPDVRGGFSWWGAESMDVVRSVREGSTVEPVQQAHEIFLAAYQKFLSKYALRPTATYGMGFSQGAALLSSLIFKKPLSFDAIALLAGFLPKKFQSLHNKLPQLPVFIGHGSKDETIEIEVARTTEQYFIQTGANVTFFVDDCGHKASSAMLKELKTWLKELG